MNHKCYFFFDSHSLSRS